MAIDCVFILAINSSVDMNRYFLVALILRMKVNTCLEDY